MRLRSTAFVLCLSACGGMSKHGYVASGGAVPYSPSVAIAGDPQTADGNTSVHHGVNPWVETAKDNLSTFAADVDTASYTLSRRTLNEGQLPPAAAVRVEEYVNYFHYTFPQPAAGSPFSVVMDAAPSPFEPNLHILRVGVATPMHARTQPANLVFLVDVSGSMNSPDRLPLAQKSLKLLVENLRPDDSVSLVTYAGSTQVVLPATQLGPDGGRNKIIRAIDKLSSGGSTAMGAGLDLAYNEALKGKTRNAISRVIVLTDGDANVGTSDPKGLQGIIADRVKAGITISTIGFGMGNYRDHSLEQLADTGDGNSFYVDNIEAAQKIFGDNLASTLEVAAKDTKLQVEFDPQMVSRYRLVGYENRTIKDEDFRKDNVDAGEMGIGHQVTAMYVVDLTDQAKAQPGPLGMVRIRHKAPDGDAATESTYGMAGAPAASFETASADLRFAYSVAAFADVLRGAEDAQKWSLMKIATTAKETAGTDKDRLELVGLIEKAAKLRGTPLTMAN